MEDLDAIAATAGPGLMVCLSVGLSFGKAMASSLNKPFIAVNHLEGHALSPKLNSELNYPYLITFNFWRPYSIFKCARIRKL